MEINTIFFQPLIRKKKMGKISLYGIFFRDDSMMFYRLFYFSFLFLFINNGCNPEIKRTADLNDQKRVVFFCESFYNYRKEKKNANASQLASGVLVSKEDLFKVLNQADSLLGDIKSFSLVKVDGKLVTKNNQKSGLFSATYNCIYEKDSTVEYFRLLSNDTSIVIDGYHIR